MKNYFKRLGVAASIFFNVLLGGKSNSTISAGQYERKRQKKWNICWLIDLFFWYDEDHCLGSWVKWKIIHSAINKNTSYKF